MTRKIDEFDFGDPPARRTNPQTSHDAAASMKKLSGPDRIAVLKLHARHSQAGLTDLELVKIMGRAGDSMRPRRGELRNAGFIESRLHPDGSEVKRPSQSNRDMLVWFITQAGLDALKERGDD